MRILGEGTFVLVLRFLGEGTFALVLRFLGEGTLFVKRVSFPQTPILLKTLC